MYTTSTEGLLNNYAVEPPVYYAEFPSEWQIQRYAFQGAIAALFVGLTILTAISVS
ncbi:MAG: ssl1498 family light-harvesting-like protein [Leptolyngbyaceae cyanobacterium bins.349]|nr:ssl1498 family light-harvesting-like protein [Leptolyngbyaceae cyanobacterium bins.349]